MRLHFIVLAALLGFSGTASAETKDQPLDIEVKAVDVRNIFSLLGQVRGTPIEVDPCVQAKVDLKLHNTPVSMVLSALGSKLHLVYEDQGAKLLVHCATEPVAVKNRYSMTATDRPLADVVDELAKRLDLGVDYRTTKRPTVSFAVKNATAPTLFAVLSDETDLSISVANKKLVVSDR